MASGSNARRTGPQPSGASPLYNVHGDELPLGRLPSLGPRVVTRGVRTEESDHSTMTGRWTTTQGGIGLGLASVFMLGIWAYVVTNINGSSDKAVISPPVIPHEAFYNEQGPAPNKVMRPPEEYHQPQGPVSGEPEGRREEFKEVEALADQVHKEWAALQAVLDDGWRQGAVPEALSEREVSIVLAANSGFHVPLSDSLPLVRAMDLPSSYDGCESVETTAMTHLSLSIVIPIRDEPLSIVLRTLHTLIDRTPGPVLSNIVIVDDGSMVDWIRSGGPGYRYPLQAGGWSEPLHLVDELKKIRGPNISLIRLPQSAENLGSSYGPQVANHYGLGYATGDVTAFIHGHCEVGPDWWWHILTRIEKDLNTVVVPNVNQLVPETLELIDSDMTPPIGMFWKMLETPLIGPNHYLDSSGGRSNIRQAKYTKSPFLGGSIFATHKNTFINHRGGFDVNAPGRHGFQYMELAIRTWMTGGKIEVSKCSLVNHLYRRSDVEDESRVGNMLNKIRTVLIWLDEGYDDLVWSVLHPATELLDVRHIGIDSILELQKWRKKHPIAKKRDFAWFMDNVFPHTRVKDPRESLTFFRKIRNKASNLCINSGDSPIHHIAGDTLKLVRCEDSVFGYDFLYSSVKKRMHPANNDEAAICDATNTQTCTGTVRTNPNPEVVDGAFEIELDYIGERLGRIKGKSSISGTQMCLAGRGELMYWINCGEEEDEELWYFSEGGIQARENLSEFRQMIKEFGVLLDNKKREYGSNMDR